MLLARPLVIGNGQLLLCFDERLALRDLYFPHVGQVNHITGGRNQIGVWMDKHLSWIGDDPWQCSLGYRPGSLVTESTAVHSGMAITVTMREAVHPRDDIAIRHVRVQNLKAHAREARLFCALDLDIDGTDVGDTALWEPHLGAVLHYKRNRCFLIGGLGPSGGIFQYATGRKRFQGAEGTWRDAEDGNLEGHPITQGAVDSTISVLAPLPGHGAVDIYFWMVCGTDFESAGAGHRLVQERGPEALLTEVEGYWKGWATGARPDVGLLPPDLQEAYYRSVLTVRTQVDHEGAILAANDSDIMAYNRDHYSYMWPRDGAFVAAAMDRAGYGALTRTFYEFCRRAIAPGGYFWHKYNPDGTVGSSWHPWVGPKGVQLPIQEDETALVLWALGRFYAIHRDHEFVGNLYPSVIRPAADFLVEYRDEATGLPHESYDLWEERRGVFTFTVASVVAGLRAAAALASLVGDGERAGRYAAVAEEMLAALERHLWDEERGHFIRGVYVRKDGGLVPDPTLESSVMGIFLLDVLPVDDYRVVRTVKALEEGLWAKTDIGGVARYYDDYYFRVGNDASTVPGNPWIICTLWVARYYIARAGSKAELNRALELIQWALRHALPSGVLPEQVHPFSGAPLSVAPLTWSHATMVDTLLDLAEKLKIFSEAH